MERITYSRMRSSVRESRVQNDIGEVFGVVHSVVFARLTAYNIHTVMTVNSAALRLPAPEPHLSGAYGIKPLKW